MPVDVKHPDYDKWAPIWERCRDVVEGEDAVKNKGQVYLPMLGGQDISEYASYKNRAMFYGASGRTVAGLMGALFRKEPHLDLPASIEFFEDQADPVGLPLVLLIREVANELLEVGRVGLLVDMPQGEAGKPYMTMYRTEDIINWRTEMVNGKKVLTQVILHEVISSPAPDGFGSTSVSHLRELVLDNGVYVQRLWKETDKGYTITGEDIIPRKRGKALDHIPFTIFSPTGLDWIIRKPPILDLVNVNLSHYRSSADLEHGRHFTALPTPWIAGMTAQAAKGQEWKIGSGTAWILPTNSTVGMLEFKGSGLSYLENALKDKQDLMVLLGARLLEPSKKSSETAEALRLRQGGETSILSTLADTVGMGITRCLQFADLWTSVQTESEAECELSKDFLDETMDPAMLRELVAGWQSGAYPREVLMFNLRRGELLPPDLTDEDIAGLSDQEVPSAGGAEPMDLTDESEQQPS